MDEYLESSTYIDWKNPSILALAEELANHSFSEDQTVQNCFEWVRDKIKHSADYKLNPITIKASDVLKHSTGYCYAKSHLLAALLRANKIPTGMCYQRLKLNNETAAYSLHGFNAVFLQNIGWYRIDPRGNKEGINAQFSPPTEQLAYSADDTGEIDFSNVLPKPLPLVISALQKNLTYLELNENLPDAKLIDHRTNT